ncbi:uncharacterized protein LOC105699781 [Orussus abietinus]|uniref:uncharacterized protein LOC105699781 n=1 Tax=Orussus abietinus TaxID=222816 RepID=UPI0006258213|nr:uncharacterized protein LOC105699781 [Orussus abietinus]
MVQSLQKDNSLQSSLFLRYMKFFVEHVISKLRLSPEEERTKELYFRKLWRENKNAQRDLSELAGLLELQRSLHYANTKSVVSQYKKDAMLVDRVNKQCEEGIKSGIIRSERRQIWALNASAMKQTELQQSVENAKNNLQLLRLTNLQIEKEIRAKRFKTESQLLALINKFDVEIKERQNILEELNEEYEKDRQEKMELEVRSPRCIVISCRIILGNFKPILMQIEMDKQLKIYNSFVKEREEAILQIFTEKLEKFMRLRAAKIIQRWWREIYARLKASKKKKKKQKGKKKR